MRVSSRSRRGVGSLIAAVFILLIIVSGFSIYLFLASQLSSYRSVIKQSSLIEAERRAEEFEITSVIASSSNLNITVRNTGNIYVIIDYVGVFTDANKTYYDIEDVYIKPKESKTINLTGITITTATIYVVSTRGNIAAYNYPTAITVTGNYTGRTTYIYSIGSDVDANALLRDFFSYVNNITVNGSLDWNYRRPITITERSGSDLTNYQIRIELNSSNFDFNNARADGGDVRITDSDGLTFLPYWIQEWNSTAQYAIIWVKVPSITASSTKTIYLYYGNDQATSLSNGNSVFEFFDAFSDNNLNLTKWTVEGNPRIEVSGGTLRLMAYSSKKGAVITNEEGCIRTKSSFLTPVAIGYRWRIYNSSLEPPQFYFAYIGIGEFSTNHYSTVGYVNSTEGESSLYSDSSRWPPWTSGESVEGYVIPDPLANTWYVSSFIAHTAFLEEVRNGASYNTSSYNGVAGNAYIGVNCTEAKATAKPEYTTIEVDWFFIRKYVSPEPLVSIGSEETGPFPLSFYVNNITGVLYIRNFDVTQYQLVLELDTNRTDYSGIYSMSILLNGTEQVRIANGVLVLTGVNPVPLPSMSVANVSMVTQLSSNLVKYLYFKVNVLSGTTKVDEFALLVRVES